MLAVKDFPIYKMATMLGMASHKAPYCKKAIYSLLLQEFFPRIHYSLIFAVIAENKYSV